MLRKHIFTPSKGASMFICKPRRSFVFTFACLLSVFLASGLVAETPAFLAGDFAPAFPLKHMAKDLRLARELAARAGLEPRIGAAVHDAYAAALAAGDGDLDFSAVLRPAPGAADAG